MLSFQELRIDKKDPVYLQIDHFVKRKILLKEVEDYEELPSRRELAISLSINPNTVQKAYKLMEEEGIIKTISNVKSVIVVNDAIISSIQTEIIEERVKDFVVECRDSGLSFQNSIALLTKYWQD